jgi:hypothetical protein
VKDFAASFQFTGGGRQSQVRSGKNSDSGGTVSHWPGPPPLILRG